MPGLLRKNANCPVCHKRIQALSCTVRSRAGLPPGAPEATLEFFHVDQTKVCTRDYHSARAAQRERTRLEVPPQ